LNALLLTISAILPSLLIMRYFHARTRYPAPRRVLWSTFGLGVLSVFGIFMILNLLRVFHGVGRPVIAGAVRAFFCAAIPEEALKLLVLVGYCARRREYDKPIDGLVYGAAASLGFATIENVAYVAENGFTVAVLRAFTAVPSHAFSGAILGWYVSQWKFGRDTYAVPKGYALVVLLHGLYDWPLMTLEYLKAASAPKSQTDLALLFAVCVTLPIVAIDVLWARHLLLRARAEQDGPVTKSRNMLEARRRILSSLASVDELLIVGGGSLASLGGIILCLVTMSNFLGGPPKTNVFIGAVILGAPPLALGLMLYTRGIRRRAARLDAQRLAAWESAAAQPLYSYQKQTSFRSL
jgi:protease PrsW